MAKVLEPQPTWLKSDVVTSRVGVDRENRVILGYVVAQEGDFKSEGRGSFDQRALKKIVTLMRQNPKGTKVRFGHPTMSDDGLGKYLGRAKNPRIDTVTVKRPEGIVALMAVRADLHIADVAMKPSETGFSLGEYILDRASEDSDSFSSSLVLSAEKEERLDPKTKRPLLDDKGNPLPPLWHPTAIHASDVVDTGDAVDGFLSAQGLPDEIVRQASELLDKQFAGQTREVVEARCQAWLQRYLSIRFGEIDPDEAALLESKEITEAETAERTGVPVSVLREKVRLMEME